MLATECAGQHRTSRTPIGDDDASDSPLRPSDGLSPENDARASDDVIDTAGVRSSPPIASKKTPNESDDHQMYVDAATSVLLKLNGAWYEPLHAHVFDMSKRSFDPKTFVENYDSDDDSDDDSEDESEDAPVQPVPFHAFKAYILKRSMQKAFKSKGKDKKKRTADELRFESLCEEAMPVERASDPNANVLAEALIVALAWDNLVKDARSRKVSAESAEVGEKISSELAQERVERWDQRLIDLNEYAIEAEELVAAFQREDVKECAQVFEDNGFPDLGDLGCLE